MNAKHLITQPSKQPTRKVAAGAVAGTVGGPLVGWAVLMLAGYELTPDCGAQVSNVLLYGAMSIGGLLSGAAGWLVRERASE